MLTDIFARRYRDSPLFDKFGEDETRLLVQSCRIVNEQVFPYRNTSDNTVNEWAKAHWVAVHDKLTMELGLAELSLRTYSTTTKWNGNDFHTSGSYDLNMVCEFWLLKIPFTGDPDRYMKERISFIELAFRERGEELKVINAKHPKEVALAELAQKGVVRLTASHQTRAEGLKAANSKINNDFERSVAELNARFEQAGMPLNYHNGFIQIATDALTQRQIDEPFWDLVKDTKWVNVDTDMLKRFRGPAMLPPMPLVLRQPRARR